MKKRTSRTSSPEAVPASERLRTRKEQVLQLWEERVCQLVPAAKEQTECQLKDDLPEFLDRLVHTLSRIQLRSVSFEELNQISQSHGEQRSSLKGYSLGQILQEYRVLREVIFQCLERNEPVTQVERDIILAAIEQGMVESVERYTTLSNRSRRAAEDDLFRTKALLGAILDQLPVGVSAAEAPSGKTLFTNKAASELVGHDVSGRKGIEEYSSYGAVHADGSHYRPEEYPTIRALMKGEVVQNEEMRYLRPDGREILMSLNSRPVRDAEGETIASVTTFVDITEQKATETALKKSQEELVQQRQSLEYQLGELNAVFESAPEAIYVGTAHGITRCNQHALDQLGFNNVEELNRDIEVLSRLVQNRDPYTGEIIPPQDVPFARALSGERTVRDTEVIHLKTGQRRIIRGSAAPIRVHGRVVGAVAINSDVTEQFEARRRSEISESRYREAKEQLDLALTGAQMGTWSVDLKTGRVTTSGDAAAILGVSGIDEDISDAIARMMHPEDQEEVDRVWREAVAGRGPFYHEYRIVRPDGEVRWVFSKGTVKLDRGGEPVQFSGVLGDITDRKLAEAQLAAEKGKLEEERELRERFVATLSHDLRSPLTTVKTSAQLLARKNDDPDLVVKITGRIVDNVDRADQMIRDLLDANRLRAGESLPIEVEACELDRVASDTLAELGTVHGDRFVLHAPDGIQGFWSRSGVRRILENLCGNAVKYGAPDGKITVSLRGLDEQVQLEVHNEGSPISPEDQATLFDQYRRTESAQRGGQKGWGLGLTLVKGLAEAHGGSVAVESSVHSGTTFRVTLPRDARTHQTSGGG